MRISKAATYALGVSAAAFALAGCNGASQSAYAPTVPGASASMSHISASPLSRIHGKRLVPAGGISGPLLYVSDIKSGIIYAFSWHFVGGVYAGKQVGLITGLVNPAGMCTDASGDVWVTELGNQDVVQFGYDDFNPTGKVLADTGQQPISCSVNKKTGDIAVGNYRTVTNGSGSVYVYPGGTVPPDEYYGIPQPTPVNWLWFVAYDGAGNLYANGCINKCGPAVLGFPGGAAAGVQIAWAPASCLPAGCNFLWSGLGLLPGGSGLNSYQDPGGMQSDGHGYLDVDDQETLPVYSTTPCIGLPKFGCGILYATTLGAPNLKEKWYVQFTSQVPKFSTLYTFQTATSLGHIGVPNPSGDQCLTGKPCIQVYYYGAGPGVGQINPVPPASGPGWPIFKSGLFGAVVSICKGSDCS